MRSLNALVLLLFYTKIPLLFMNLPLLSIHVHIIEVVK